MFEAYYVVDPTDELDYENPAPACTPEEEERLTHLLEQTDDN